MPDATVLVIDDDPALLASLERLLRSVRLNARLFASTPKFLESDPPDGPTYLALDVQAAENSRMAPRLTLGDGHHD